MTALGTLSLAQEALRTTLAASATWQALCEAAGETPAIERIYRHGLPKPANGEHHTVEELRGYRPYAVVFTAEEQGLVLSQAAMSDSIDFEYSGRLKLRLYRNCPEAYDDEPTSEANADWENTVGQIIDELAALAGRAGYLAPYQITVDRGPYWSHPKSVPDEGVWQGVEIGLAWRGV